MSRGTEIILTHQHHFVPQLKLVYGMGFSLSDMFLRESDQDFVNFYVICSGKARDREHVIHLCNKHILNTYYVSCTLLNSKDAEKRTYSACRLLTVQWEKMGSTHFNTVAHVEGNFGITKSNEEVVVGNVTKR